MWDEKNFFSKNMGNIFGLANAYIFANFAMETFCISTASIKKYIYIILLLLIASKRLHMRAQAHPIRVTILNT